MPTDVFIYLRFMRHLLHIFKGNMHHKYDISLKDAFYIIDLAAGIFFFFKFES